MTWDIVMILAIGALVVVLLWPQARKAKDRMRERLKKKFPWIK